MSITRSMYTRMAAAGGSMALTLSLALAPAAMAQDDPVSTVESFAAAIEAKDFENLPAYFCADMAGDMGGLGFGDITAGFPDVVDVQLLLDTFDIDVEIESLELVSESETEAVVDMIASISMSANVDSVVVLMEAMAEAFGMEVSEADIESAKADAGANMPEAQDISEQITLVPGDAMAWVICSELGGDGDDDTADDEMAEDEMAEDDMEVEIGE